jgi:Flp pilus assembly protein TadG
MRFLGNSRGTSTLEFAVVLPFLLFVLFAIVELSRAWLTLNLVTTAAREAARVAVVTPAGQFPNPPPAMARITEILNGQGTGTITCAPSPCAPDATVTATVSVTFQTVVPLILPMLASMNIQQTATMRYE